MNKTKIARPAKAAKKTTKKSTAMVLRRSSAPVVRDREKERLKRELARVSLGHANAVKMFAAERTRANALEVSAAAVQAVVDAKIRSGLAHGHELEVYRALARVAADTSTLDADVRGKIGRDTLAALEYLDRLAAIVDRVGRAAKEQSHAST